MAESDAATMERLRKEMGEKVEIPVPEGMIPVHDNKATAVLAAPGDLERLRESMEQELVMSTLAGSLSSGCLATRSCRSGPCRGPFPQ